LDLAAAAAEAGVDVVSTFVYGHPADRGYVDRLVAAVEGGGGTLVTVQPCRRRRSSRSGSHSPHGRR
jgi:hypothetical protein